MKKILTIGVTLLAAITLAACGSSSSKSTDSSSKTEKATKVDSSKESSKKASSSSKAADDKAIPTSPDEDWFYSKDKDVFYAGNETMTFTKTEVRDGLDDGEKVLVVYANILNNSKEEQDPSNFYMVLHAKQKTDTSNVDLDVGMLGINDDGTSPLQTEEDNLNNALLPGKTVPVVMMWTLVNTNDVTLEMSNADFTTIGTKTISVQ